MLKLKKDLNIVYELNMKLTKWLFAISIAVAAKSALADQTAELQSLLDTRACRNCTLSGLNIGQYDLKNVDLAGANLSKAYLVHTDFHGANLNNANLAGAYLNGARLSKVFLVGTNFRKAELELANFAEATFDNVDFSEAYLLHAVITKEQFEHSILCQTVMPDASKSNRDCQN